MSDEQEHVDAGSETSGEQEGTAQVAPPETSEPAQADTDADAGGAADVAEADAPKEEVPNPDESRTGFADKGLRAGDACECPDGRKGTVHSFDAGLICLPNHEG